MRNRIPFALLATALACSLFAAPVQAAGAARTFVSAAGSDSNNCTNVITPCRHFATAYAATAPNGEIYVLDPANYGSLTITGPVSIEGHGWASVAPTTGNPAITINANPGDKINIIGVVLDGTAIPGTTGILFNSGGSLNVHDSIIRDFVKEGIDFFPNASSTLDVSDTLVSSNGDAAIYAQPTGSGTVSIVLNRVTASDNGNNGIVIDGGTSTGTVTVTVSESVASGNVNYGIAVASASGKAPTTMMVFHSVAANNGTGLLAQDANATMYIANSTVTGNTNGWGTLPGGVLLSYGDNYIDGNVNASTQIAPPSTARK